MVNYKHPIISKEAQEAVRGVLETGLLSGFRGTIEGQFGGTAVQRLEGEFSDYFSSQAIAVQSATAGLHTALLSYGIGKGDEVIVSPYSFASSASCVLMAGAKPVFVDIQDDIFCIDPTKIEITPKTKAIIPVHLMGHPADMNPIMELARKYNLIVIEDAAQALGATYKGKLCGTIGNCGIFSFNQSKPVSTGEGGMIITNDNPRRMRAIRNHAEVSDPDLGIIGYNYRLCEIEATLAFYQFQDLEEMNAHRIQLTDYMTEELLKIDGLIPPVTYYDCKHVFYTYAVKYNKTKISRDTFQDELMKRGVYFGKGYVKPLYLLPVFKGRKGMCPVAERMYEEIMVTDIFKYPMTLDEVKGIIKIIKEVLDD